MEKAIAESKAKGWKGGRSAGTHRGSNLSRSSTIKPHLLVADGKPRNSSGRPPKASGKKRPAETLATATAQQKPRNQSSDRVTLKDMKKLYSPSDWSKRVGSKADKGTFRFADHRDPKLAHLFNKDVHPKTGKPFCISCQAEGHTINRGPDPPV